MAYEIKSLFAREVFTRQEFSGLEQLGVETTVMTEGGAIGVAVATGGFSVGKFEVRPLYDGGPRWGGRGVSDAVANVNKIIGPALKSMKATRQDEIDRRLIELDGTSDKSKLGANAISSVSAAVLKAGAASLGLPLYQHIGGINACILPIPGLIVLDGSDRYGKGEGAGNKPSYSFVCYDFKSFSEASYACWKNREELRRILKRQYGVSSQSSTVCRLAPGKIKHDREIWAAMTETIENLGYKGKAGIQVDIAATTYHHKGKFRGLFSTQDKTREDLMELYREMVREYPFVTLEDPLAENDFEGHAILTKKLGVQIVGDDLFATNVKRLKLGIEAGACSAVLLKMPQIGTVSEALDVAQMAHRNGYAVIPCGSRGEGPDIADYAVGLNTGQIREGGTGPTANRLMMIEAELGSQAKFPGRKTLKIK